MYKDRRNSLRHPLALDVTLRAGERVLRGKSVDISRSGIFVVLGDCLADGRRVDLEITSPVVEAPVLTSGIVVHSVARLGVGLRFSHQNEHTRELIGRMIESLKRTA